jgi:hypothetical protein
MMYGLAKLSQEPHRLTDRVLGGVRTMKVIRVVVADMTVGSLSVAKKDEY